MPNPPYAMIANRSIGLGPYVQTGGQLHTFCIDGDAHKIDAFLHSMFGAPSGGAVEYEAATSKLFLSFAYFPSVRAMGPPDDTRGIVPERDAALWALARRKGTLFEFRWIPLWLFVDDGSAMSTGREVYGFPKQLGVFDMPITPPPSQGPFRMSAKVMNPFAPTTVSTLEPMFEFEAVPGTSGGSPLTNLADGLLSKIGSVLRSGTVEGLEKALGGKSFLFDVPVTMAFLKQFPATHDTTKACFQSIVEADARTLKVRNAGWTATEFRGRVFSYDSHPYADALGIPTGQISVGSALFADFDFEMELGKDIWTAS